AQVRDRVFKHGRPQPLHQLTTDAEILTALKTLDQLLAKGAAPTPAFSSNEQLLYKRFATYRNVLDGIHAKLAPCPPSGAIVGVYASIDRQRGVWKAPA